MTAAEFWRLVAAVVVALVAGGVLGAVLAWAIRAHHRRWSVTVHVASDERQGRDAQGQSDRS